MLGTRAKRARRQSRSQVKLSPRRAGVRVAAFDGHAASDIDSDEPDESGVGEQSSPFIAGGSRDAKNDDR